MSQFFAAARTGAMVLAALFILNAPAQSAHHEKGVVLAGTEWGFPDETGENARFVRFGDDNTLSGHTGCNRFAGDYQLEGDKLKIGLFAINLAACPEDMVERERELREILENTQSVEMKDGTLILKGADGKALGELTRRAAD